MRPIRDAVNDCLDSCLDRGQKSLLTDVRHWFTLFPIMARETFEAEIKTRVPANVKQAFQVIADSRHLDMADIVREAFREYLAKQQPEIPQQQTEKVAA